MEQDERLKYLLTVDGVSYLPLSNLMPHQQEVLQEAPQRFKVMVWHRRARKTTTAIHEIVKQAHLRIGVYWHVFPTKTEAKDAIWRDPAMLFNIVPEDLILKTNESELIIYFKNGSIYQLKGADEPDSLRGAGPVGIVLDEFATMKLEAWQIIEPILRANGGWCWFIGTPRGKNHLFQFYHMGQRGDPEWRSWLLKASTSLIIPLDQLEKSKITSTQAIWNQEYECDFLEGEGAVFRGVREVMTAVPHKPMEGHYYVMGVDLAKVQDYTTIRVYDRSTNKQVYKDRFQTLEWPFQKKRIAAVAKLFNNALCVLDSTGLGDPIADDLSRMGVAIEAFKIGEQSKKDLIEKLSIWIEQKRIALLPDQDTLFEYDNFSYEIGPTGKIRYGARDGFHDDIVIGDALAVWALTPLIKEVLEKPKTRTQIAYEEAKKDYEENNTEQDIYQGDDLNEWSTI
jgi:hypothetical protein